MNINIFRHLKLKNALIPASNDCKIQTGNTTGIGSKGHIIYKYSKKDEFVRIQIKNTMTKNTVVDVLCKLDIQQ